MQVRQEIGVHQPEERVSARQHNRTRRKEQGHLSWVTCRVTRLDEFALVIGDCLLCAIYNYVSSPNF
jgi:hypothetical protein